MSWSSSLKLRTCYLQITSQLSIPWPLFYNAVPTPSLSPYIYKWKVQVYKRFGLFYFCDRDIVVMLGVTVLYVHNYRYNTSSYQAWDHKPRNIRECTSTRVGKVKVHPQYRIKTHFSPLKLVWLPGSRRWPFARSVFQNYLGAALRYMMNIIPCIGIPLIIDVISYVCTWIGNP